MLYKKIVVINENVVFFIWNIVSASEMFVAGEIDIEGNYCGMFVAI